VDDHLVEPETHTEMIDGVTCETPSATEAQAAHHVRAAHVLTACVSAGYKTAIALLTRADWNTDVAPDVSVFPSARDPKTGGRQLEELAFAVYDREREAYTTRKAAKLATRGVRRLFAVDVEAHGLHEWQHTTAAWRPLDVTAEIIDRCLRVPIPTRAFFDREAADDTVARAFLAAGNRVIERALAERERQSGLRGRWHALAAAVLRVLERRGVALDDRARARVLACDDRDQLDAWLDRAVIAATAADVFEG